MCIVEQAFRVLPMYTQCENTWSRASRWIVRNNFPSPYLPCSSNSGGASRIQTFKYLQEKEQVGLFILLPLTFLR